jgi:hypothetical protein
MAVTPFPGIPQLVRQAAIPLAGYTLINGTGDIAGGSWTAPNDGLVHEFLILASLHVTTAETGGQIVVNYTMPDGTVVSGASQVVAGGHAAGTFQGEANSQVAPGTTVTLHQQAALTVGAAVFWASIYGA